MNNQNFRIRSSSLVCPVLQNVKESTCDFADVLCNLADRLLAMKARYLPVVLWSLLYISVAFLAQGTIAIYGLAFANIAELGKHSTIYMIVTSRHVLIIHGIFVSNYQKLQKIIDPCNWLKKVTKLNLY